MSPRDFLFRGSSNHGIGSTLDEHVQDSAEPEVLEKKNDDLQTLAIIFPDILPEVFREALSTFSGESRLPIAVDQLLKNQDQWVRGRWRRPEGRIQLQGHDHNRSAQGDPDISTEEKFRRAKYKWAVYATLCQEFRGLSKSTIKAVLAEENHCYSRCRTTLNGISSKSWRSAFSAFWSRWRKSAEERDCHYMVEWKSMDINGNNIGQYPSLKETGDVELDAELYRTVLAPLLASLRDEQTTTDWELANQLNEKEAQSAGALYECQCCFSDVTFEQIATCTIGAHYICRICISRSVAESLFGQGWSRSVDHHQGLLKCPSIILSEPCSAHISNNMISQALQISKGGPEMWQKWESRLSATSLETARISLLSCPFCPYSEIDELYVPPSSRVYRINSVHPKTSLLTVILTLTFLPFLIIYVILSNIKPMKTTQFLPSLTNLLSDSLTRLNRHHHRPQRFQCRHPNCSLPSCLICHSQWRDPHTCYESATQSLRTAIESARTAALKRTCPRCNLAFIKDSGCNKLTCVCGYSMCYICRQGLGRKVSSGRGTAAVVVGRQAQADIEGEGEGYRHFCQHFRPLGGKCQECDKCDLYKDVDDDDVVLRAGIEAEKAWREREGMVGVKEIGAGVPIVQQQQKQVQRRFQNDRRLRAEPGAGPGGSGGGTWRIRDWSLRGWMDLWVDVLITC